MSKPPSTPNPSAKASSRAAEALATARRLLVTTGSGMSAESGIPTFRGPGGLWEGQRPEDVATPQAFARDPVRVWRWYRDRIARHASAQPHPGHRAVAALEAHIDHVLVATQNVDALHEAAGSTRVVHVHGTMHRNRCAACGRRSPLDVAALQRLPPRCADCRGLLRPDIVWFGEALPPEEWSQAEAFARQADACLAVGSSHLVWPAATLPLLAREAGAVLIEVNTEPSGLTPSAHVFVQGPAATVLPAILEKLGAKA